MPTVGCLERDLRTLSVPGQPAYGVAMAKSGAKQPRRTCLFTGVSGRLGRDFCARYTDRYDIIGVWWSTKPDVPICKLGSTDKDPGAIFGLRTDLREEGAVEAVAEKVIARFDSVDLVVNAAVYRRFGPLRARPFLDSLDWQFFLNAAAPVRLVSALVRGSWQATPEENRQRRRNVVNLSSIAATVVYEGRGQGGYAATKAALDAFTRHQASELAPIGIRVNGLAPNTFPGLVPTESVSDKVVELDKGSQSGQILIMDKRDEVHLSS
jgi:NAD(P)-dependent dehydrogenase (short-subunit alcohol dehydrogenase family)